MVFQINSCIYIYIYIRVTLCDGSQREVRSTPHQTFTFEHTTAVFIDLHMFLHFFYYYLFYLNSQPHANLHYKNQETTKRRKTNVHNLHAAQSISRTPNQHVNRKMFSATTDFDTPMEI